VGMAGLVFSVLDEPAFAGFSDDLKLRLIEAAADLMPDNTGGAVLLGVQGVCVISHGSSSARAIVNAVRVALTCVEADIVAAQTAAVAGAAGAGKPTGGGGTGKRAGGAGTGKPTGGVG